MEGRRDSTRVSHGQQESTEGEPRIRTAALLVGGTYRLLWRTSGPAVRRRRLERYSVSGSSDPREVLVWIARRANTSYDKVHCPASSWAETFVGPIWLEVGSWRARPNKS